MEKLLYSVVLFVLSCKTSTGYPTSENEHNCSKVAGLTCEMNQTVLEIDQEIVEQCWKDVQCEAGLYNQDIMIQRIEDKSNLSLITLNSCYSRIDLKIHYIKDNKWIVVCYKYDENSTFSSGEVFGSEQEGEGNEEGGAGTIPAPTTDKRHHWSAMVPETVFVILILMAIVIALVKHQKTANNSQPQKTAEENQGNGAY